MYDISSLRVNKSLGVPSPVSIHTCGSGSKVMLYPLQNSETLRALEIQQVLWNYLVGPAFLVSYNQRLS